MFDCVLFYGNSNQIAASRSGGTQRIATELRQNGYSVVCIDITPFFERVELFKKLLDKIVTEKTLWLGISTTFLFDIFDKSYHKSEEKHSVETPIFDGVIDHIKKLNPKIKLISGGSRYFPLEKYSFKIFKGYSDKEIVDFTDWCSKKNTEKINLDFYGNKIQGSEFKEFTTSKIIYEPEDFIMQDDFLPIELARGCIFKCKFCSYPLNGKKKGDFIKLHSVFREELIDNYEKYGLTEYIFCDDTFNDSAEKIKYLYDNVFSNLPFKINFVSYLRLDLLMRYPETVEYLKESGLTSTFFGIETINEKSGKAIGKGVPPKEQFNFLTEIKKTHFKDVLLGSGFMLGLPFDTIETLEETRKFFQSNNNPLDHWDVNPLWLNPLHMSKNKDYYSEFDLEYEKYGYEVFSGEDKYNHVFWQNKKTGLTYEMCQKYAYLIQRDAVLNQKYKIGGFRYAYFRSLGISKEEIFKFSKGELFLKKDLKQLSMNRQEKYIDKLKDYFKI
jgi:radical SAM superfamily enzyme YgiQ (UPF0313 family)